MSTNINNGLPDVELLSQLANQFFKKQPGEVANVPNIPQPLPTHGYNPVYQSYLTEAGNLHTSPPDPHIATPVAAPSFSGAGVSPGSAVQQVNQIDLTNKETNTAASPYSFVDTIPASAGSNSNSDSNPSANYF